MNSSRADVVVWLRRTHGWIGLWGATLGLLFGFSGIWLNHRAVLALQPAADKTSSQLRLESPPPATPRDLAMWVQYSLGSLDPATSVRVEKARPAPWAEPSPSAPAVAMQPEHWIVNFNTPKSQVQADYWLGNRTVGVRRTDNGVVATLTNLHKGVGMPVAWILLVDTLAGSLILLSLSGLSLWLLTRRRRTVGLAIFGAALAVTAGLAIAHL